MKKYSIFLFFTIFSLFVPISAKADDYGWYEKDGNKYYRDSNGENLVGFQPIDGKIYFFSRDKTKYGALKTGMLTVGDYNYYLNPEAQIGWFEYQGNKYYANEQGEIQVGFQPVDGKTYFFSRDRTKYGALKTGMLTVGDYNYYLNPEAQIGWFEYQGNKYYANEQGEIQVGFQIINGEKYFFSRDKTRYGAMRTGWINIDWDYYYFDESGKAVREEKTIDGTNYKFNSETGRLDGLIEKDGKIYYYYPNGEQAKGIKYLANKFWKFNEETGEFEKFVRQIRVIDISHNNGNIDWNRVKQSGLVDAVILRIGFRTPARMRAPPRVR